MKKDRLRAIIDKKPIISIGDGNQGAGFMLYDFGDDFNEDAMSQFNRYQWLSDLDSNVKINDEKRVNDWHNHLLNTMVWYIKHSANYVGNGTKLGIYTGATVSDIRRYDLKKAGLDYKGDGKTFIIYDRGNSINSHKCEFSMQVSALSNPESVAKSIKSFTKNWVAKKDDNSTDAEVSNNNNNYNKDNNNNLQFNRAFGLDDDEDLT